MNIAIIGSGYVGLVSGACLAAIGHTVTCVDVSAERIADLNAGHMPIYEPGLKELVASQTAAHRLSFTINHATAVANADAIFIAVGTPQGDDGKADLTQVKIVASNIGMALNGLGGYRIIVTKSTVPVGTGDVIETIIRDAAPDAAFHVVSNPEFLREGQAIEDFLNPDRIVIGADTAWAKSVMYDLYEPIAANKIYVDRRTAELIKYAANAFLAMKITFINEIADLCEAVGADIGGVSSGIGSDQRIGPDFLRPGPGYGGSCFPKDTVALSRTAAENNSALSLIDATIAVNAARKRAMGHKVIDALGGDVDGKQITLLGLTFKAGTDDMRDSPAIDIIDVLQEHGAFINACDPQGVRNASAVLDEVDFYQDPYEACFGSDAIVMTTDWAEFKSLGLGRLARAMHTPVMVDLRNMIDPASARRAGFLYSGIGRPLQPALTTAA